MASKIVSLREVVKGQSHFWMDGNTAHIGRVCQSKCRKHERHEMVGGQYFHLAGTETYTTARFLVSELIEMGLTQIYLEYRPDPLAAELGRRGGAVTGGAKAEASRTNGKRGGRRISPITARAIELWKALPDFKLGEFPNTYDIRMTLTAEFPDETSARISNCAMQAVRMLKREAKK